MPPCISHALFIVAALVQAVFFCFAISASRKLSPSPLATGAMIQSPERRSAEVDADDAQLVARSKRVGRVAPAALGKPAASSVKAKAKKLRSVKKDHPTGDRSEARSSAVVEACKRIKVNPKESPPAEMSDFALTLVRPPADLDVFTKYLHANLLRCDDTMFDKWAWVKGVPFIPFMRKQQPRAMAQNLYAICEALQKVIGLELLQGYLQIPRDQVIATIMASSVGFTPMWVKTLGKLPRCEEAWPRSWKEAATKRLMRHYHEQKRGKTERCEMFNTDITVIRSRSYSNAADATEAKRRCSEALDIVKDIWAAAPAARRIWMAGCRDGDPSGLQAPVLKALAVKHVPHLGYQQWLAHVVLQALCPKWEQARGQRWCRAMGRGVSIALADVFKENAETYSQHPEQFDSRLEEVTRYVAQQWHRVNGEEDPVPKFDEEDIAPQLCEWHRLGKPSQCIDSPHVQFRSE